MSLALTGVQNTGGAGTDTLLDIENIRGSDFNDRLTGNSANNVLFGLGGNDQLNGGAGTDTASYSGALAGVTVQLGLAGEQNTGGAGRDTLVSIETVTGSNYNDRLEVVGNDNYTVNGGAGNDILEVSGEGANIINGGAGDDTFRDTSSFHSSLGSTVNGGPGNDDLYAIRGILNGDEGDDTLGTSEIGATLNGGAGNDHLSAFAGGWLNGGDGDDELWASNSFDKGGNGGETLTGGSGADRLFRNVDDKLFPAGQVIFDYNAVSDSPAGAGKDTITGFSGGGVGDVDQIDLSTIDARPSVDGNQAFIWGGPWTEGHLRYVGGVLQGNLDTDAAPEFEIQLVGAPTLFVSAGHPGSDILL